MEDLELTKVSLSAVLSEEGLESYNNTLTKIRETGAQISQAMPGIGVVICLADKNEINKLQNLVGSVLASVELEQPNFAMGA